MGSQQITAKLALVSLLSFSLSACYHPPYNNFKPYNRSYLVGAGGAAIGSAAVAVVGGPTLLGTAIGGTIGSAIGLYKESRQSLVNSLPKYHIQSIQYGDTLTFVVPTDRYFLFNSARFKESCYLGLAKLIKLINSYPRCCPIYVAGFTDNVGSRYQKNRLSQARAETMLTYLWANSISAQRLNAEGYGDKYDVGDNKLIHGSAHNRRLEIQLITSCRHPMQQAPMRGYIK